jgi:hypothetical protein
MLQRCVLASGHACVTTPHRFAARICDSQGRMLSRRCPPSYPDTPPKVTLVTTGYGTIRFNPNLYEDGLVCSSLLDQGSGWGQVTWRSGESNLVEVCKALMWVHMNGDVYFAEPDTEDLMDTKEGQAANQAYCDIVRYGNVRFVSQRLMRASNARPPLHVYQGAELWTITPRAGADTRTRGRFAMVEQLRKPAKDFEVALRLHFALRHSDLLSMCESWIETARRGHVCVNGKACFPCSLDDESAEDDDDDDDDDDDGMEFCEEDEEEDEEEEKEEEEEEEEEEEGVGDEEVVNGDYSNKLLLEEDERPDGSGVYADAGASQDEVAPPYVTYSHDAFLDSYSPFSAADSHLMVQRLACLCLLCVCVLQVTGCVCVPSRQGGAGFPLRCSAVLAQAPICVCVSMRAPCCVHADMLTCC